MTYQAVRHKPKEGELQNVPCTPQSWQEKADVLCATIYNHKTFCKKIYKVTFIRNTPESQSKISRMKMLSLEQTKEAHQGMFLASNGDICF